MNWPKYELDIVRLHPSGNYDLSESVSSQYEENLKTAKKRAGELASALSSSGAVELSNTTTGELLYIYYRDGRIEKVHGK